MSPFSKAGGGGAAGAGHPSGEAAAGALLRAGMPGAGFEASGQALEQRPGGSGASRGDGPGARALPGLRSDFRPGEAGGGARSPIVGGDAAAVDDRGRVVEAEAAPGGSCSPEPSAAGVPGGSGADRWVAARLVRRARAGVHADRVHRRRDESAAGVGLLAAETTKAFDGTATVLREGRELPVRRLAVGEAAVPVEDGKTVVRRVEKAKAEQRSRPACKPAPDHPWRSGCDVRAASRVAAG